MPCHNDLLPANFLRDGDALAIIDWEYAGMNDRYFDLGNLAVNNELGRRRRAALLEAYFGERRAAARRRAAPDAPHVRRARGAVGRRAGRVSDLDFDYGATRARTSSACARAPPTRELEEWLDAAAA